MSPAIEAMIRSVSSRRARPDGTPSYSPATRIGSPKRTVTSTFPSRGRLAPTGIDVLKVARTGWLPQINTGMAGRVAGTGQVGAGLVTPPAEIFPQALAALAARV